MPPEAQQQPTAPAPDTMARGKGPQISSPAPTSRQQRTNMGLPTTPSNFLEAMARRNEQGLDDPTRDAEPDAFDKPASPAGIDARTQATQPGAAPTSEQTQPADPQQAAVNDNEPSAPAVNDNDPASGAPAIDYNQMALPDEAYDLLVKVPGDNGTVREMPLREALQGNMRWSDYTKKTQEVAQLKQQVQARADGMSRFFQEIREPQVLLDRFIELGYEPVLDQALKIRAQQAYEEQQFISQYPEGQREMAAKIVQERRQQQAQLRQMAAELKQAKQVGQNNQQQEQNNQFLQRMQNQTAQLLPLAFKQFKLPRTPYTEQVFANQLIAMIQAGPFNGDITREMALAAATATRELLESDLAPAQAHAQQAAPRPPGLPPQRTSGAGTVPVNGADQRKKPADFRQDMIRRNGGYDPWG